MRKGAIHINIMGSLVQFQNFLQEKAVEATKQKEEKRKKPEPGDQERTGLQETR
jgi:hypothetical protein